MSSSHIVQNNWKAFVFSLLPVTSFQPIAFNMGGLLICVNCETTLFAGCTLLSETSFSNCNRIAVKGKPHKCPGHSGVRQAFWREGAASDSGSYARASLSNRILLCYQFLWCCNRENIVKHLLLSTRKSSHKSYFLIYCY